MSFRYMTPEEVENMPYETRAYADRVRELVNRFLVIVNAELVESEGRDTTVVLDALMNTYVYAGKHTGRELDCANTMLQIAGQVVLSDAMHKQAAGIDPMAAPNVH